MGGGPSNEVFQGDMNAIVRNNQGGVGGLGVGVGIGVGAGIGSNNPNDKK